MWGPQDLDVRSWRKHVKQVVPVRLELTTLGLLDPRSNQLSYETWLLCNLLLSRFKTLQCQ